MNRYVKALTIGAALGLMIDGNVANYRMARDFLDVRDLPAEYRDTAWLNTGGIIREKMEKTNPLFRPGYAIALMMEGHGYPSVD